MVFHETKFTQFCFRKNKTQSRQKLLSMQVRQMLLSYRIFNEMLDLLNIPLFQNTVDCVCLVIQRYSRSEKKGDIQSDNISPIRCCFPFHYALFNNLERICQVLKILCWFSVLNNICQKMIFAGKKTQMSKYWWEEKNRWAKTDEQKMLRWAKEWWARFLRQMSTLSHRWATPTTLVLMGSYFLSRFIE